ncbi:uncharacterized protein si:dkey-250k15.4 [Xyrichtys novacula]|uniref:Uncharacterized protein si:dkey-250k15.4 n=1 Tax=Xyrichtys novacula TaxID=13765 RepID=A0AAV1FQR4_XYRNO|nr:uncharacterized protein si:dkey-250k15.4 [Xyrichtys novacula]
MRGFGKEAPKSQSHHHRCRCQSSKDITYVHDSCRHSSCHSSCRCASRQEALFLNVVPTAQEPSIITDSRLIGHHGLFNHEVKSIDIDRLLSKQKKKEKNGQQDHENNAISRPSSTSHIPSPISSNDILGTEPDEVVILEKEGEPAVKAHVDCQEKEDETPKQKTNTVMSEKPTETLLTPADNGDNMMTLNKKEMTSTLKQTPKNDDGVSRSTFQLPSSRTAESSDSRHQRPDPSSLSESVQSVAASLCGRQLFPLLRRRDLVKESREVLLKALKERHGPWLQENLFRLRQYPSSGFDHSKEVQDQEPTMRDEDEFQRTDAFTTEFQASNPFSVSPQRKYSKRKRSAYLNLRFSPQQLLKPEQPAEWLRQPVETSTGLLDNFLKSPHSPQFSMDFEPSGIRDYLFAPSSTSCWEEKNSAFPHWGDTLSRQKSEEASTFNSFGNSFVNQTRARDALQYSLSTAQSVPPYYTQLPDRYSTEPVHFPQEQDPFRAERHSFPILPIPTSTSRTGPQLTAFQPSQGTFSLPSPKTPPKGHDLLSSISHAGKRHSTLPFIAPES